MTTKKNILNAIDRYAFEWQLDSKFFKASFQELYKKLDNLDKKVDTILASLPEKPAPADKPKIRRPPWTESEEKLLLYMREMKKTYEYIGNELGRSPKAVQLRYLRHVKTTKAE